MKSCKYCAQRGRLDQFGYCIKYSCFDRSGEKSFLENLVVGAKELWFNDKTMQISGPVSNFYSRNHRLADDLKYKATNRWGFIPDELSTTIPQKFMYNSWDKNIRW